MAKHIDRYGNVIDLRGCDRDREPVMCNNCVYFEAWNSEDGQCTKYDKYVDYDYCCHGGREE